MVSKFKKKGLFLGLSTLGLIFASFLMWAVWIFVSPRISTLTPILWLNKTITFIALYGIRIYFSILFIGIILILLTSIFEKNFLIARFAVRLSIRFVFPIALTLGKWFGIEKDKIRESYVHVNNSFVNAMKNTKFNASEILILLPHCLQYSECKVRITNNISHCYDCGKCDISDLKKLSQKYGVKISIATGGTLARKIIIQAKPKIILAVACQRDLVSGMQDVFPIPVLGILNERPNGPCVSTRVFVPKIEEALENLIRK